MTVSGKRWTRVLPILIVLYIINFIDRNNISFAVIGGMEKELHMTTSISGLAGGLFYIGYVLLAVPSGIIATKYNNKKLIAVLTFLWGIVALSNGFVQNATQLLIMRFLLGFFEGGVWTAILVLLSNWFHEKERATANAIWLMNMPLSFIIMGPLSGLLINYVGWRMLFILQGLPAVIMAIVFYLLVESRPEEAKWLSREEKEYILSGQTPPTETKRVGYKGAILHPQVLLMSSIYFFWLIGAVGFFMWLPSIIKEMSNKGIMNVGLISALPYIMALIGLFTLGRLSDRTRNRRRFVAISLLGFSGFLFLSALTAGSYTASLIFITFAGFFIFATHAPFWAMPVELFPREFSGAAMGMIGFIGNIGSFTGPYLVGYVRQVTGSFTYGVLCMVISLLTAAILTLFIKHNQSTSVETDASIRIHH